MIHELRHFFQAILDVQGFQNQLFFLCGGIDNGGDHIRQDAGHGDGFGHDPEFLG